MEGSEKTELSTSQYAYNHNLYAYVPNIDNREQRKVIKVGRLQKGNGAEQRKEILKNAFSSVVKLPDLEPTPEEEMVDLDDNKTKTAIVVGVRPFDQPLSVPAEKSASVNTLKQVKKQPFSLKTVRVVCPRFKDTAIYYALTDRDEESGLCNGVMIDGSEVFFFPEFRDDDLTSEDSRKAGWGKIVRESLSKTDQKKRKEKNLKDVNKFEADEKTDLCAEIASLT